MRNVGLPRLPIVALAALAFGVVLGLLPEQLQAGFEYQRDAPASGEAWRLWTAHFVHYSWRHAGMDLATLFALAAGIEIRCGRRALLMVLLAAPPLLSVILYFAVPDLACYRGASALCVELGAMLWLVLWSEAGARRVALLLPAIAFVIKTVYEATGASANLSGLAGDIHVAWQAHAAGAILGILGFAIWRGVVRAGTGGASIQENRDAVSTARLLA